MPASNELLQRDIAAADVSVLPFAALLKEIRQRVAIDPFANPIQLLALDLNARVDRGEIGIDDLDDAVRRLTIDAFEERAERLGVYLGQTDPAANERAIEEIMERIAADGFDKFREIVERAAFGIVFTAHPTCSITHELAIAMAEVATLHASDGAALCDDARTERLALACALDHRSERNLTLDVEQAWSVEALECASCNRPRPARSAAFGAPQMAGSMDQPFAAAHLAGVLGRLRSGWAYRPDLDGRDSEATRRQAARAGAVSDRDRRDAARRELPVRFRAANDRCTTGAGR